MEEHQLLHPEGVAFIRERNDLFQQQTSADEDCPTTPATPSTVELKCDVCPFKTNIYQRMWNHKQKHKKMSKYVCSKCSFR
ncbi:unnamed protein product [Nippostrongylus brasiliensis]|uniref:C2H2-type domain-containing protein n=1 Tax=Nippostrongylus brasiliensis TaxID=27835 RepID=A0A0N4XNE8_NIPBR|nr:unnamed protein product [Nippostrongylus brasiliensis]VDL67700.1 unnamed protein product [Nippostrongylus brasiliensis]